MKSIQSPSVAILMTNFYRVRRGQGPLPALPHDPVLRSTYFESSLKWGIEQILIIFKEDSIVHVIKTTNFYRPEGNVFAPVCDSVHRSGWGGCRSLCLGRSLSRGLCPGGLCLGGLCPGGSVWRESLSRGSLSGGSL